MKNNILVSVIIVNWNGLKYLKTCLTSLAKQHDVTCEIIFVDNASEDKSVPYVRKHFPDISIIENSTNLGFAEGNNIGVQHAHGKYILLLNTDTELDSKCIFKLSNFMENNNKAGAVQPKLLLMDEKTTLDSCGSYYTDLAYLYHFGYRKIANKDSYSKNQKFFSVKGACMMIRRNIIQEIGLFDSTFWNYYEETDFCHRAWVHGYECWYVPSAVAYHKDGGSQVNVDWSRTYFHNHKNKIRSMLKNFSIPFLFRYLLVYLTVSLLYELFTVLFQSRRKATFLLMKAILWNVINARETLSLRKKVQTQRRVQDIHILNEVKRNPNIQYFLPWVGAAKYYEV